MHQHGLGQKVHLGEFEILVSQEAASSQLSFKTKLKFIG